MTRATLIDIDASFFNRLIITKKLEGFGHLPKEQKLSRCSSEKANKVLEILRSSICEASRAIVFVMERQTAPALAHLINLAEIPGVKAGYAVGSTFSPIHQPSSGLFYKVIFLENRRFSLNFLKCKLHSEVS
jgi:hypothetical protein